MLVGAMNPCPCGYAGSELRPCRCTPQQVERYASRLSGPLRDRIDLAVSVAAVPPRDLHGDVGGEGSSAIRDRVVSARGCQLARDGTLNARLEGRRLRTRVRLDAASRTLLEKAVSRLTLSARAFDRVLRVGRTIADLAGSDAVIVEHLAEALQFRGSR
jgi:magnesium chelatase family protein